MTQAKYWSSSNSRFPGYVSLLISSLYLLTSSVKIVVHEVDLRCTVMANAPDADFELLFYRFEHDSSFRKNKKGEATQRDIRMRIRLMRKRQLVEISRQVSVTTTAEREQVGEWVKKVIVAPGGNFAGIDRRTLDDEETTGLARALGFVSLCDIFERRSASSRTSTLNAVGPESELSQTPPDPSGLPHDLLTASLKRVPGNLSLPRLPAQLPQFSPLEQSSKSFSASYEGFDTRFIPSVGWCVRYGFSGGAGRYKMMFFDGAILEVDVDGECVEFMNSMTDEVVR
jgi:polo-like kinase 4